MIIIKKIEPEFFDEILAGKKFYELRLGDFSGRPGDFLTLMEKDVSGAITGRELTRQITYASTFRLNDLPWPREDVDRLGIALMSIELLSSGRAIESRHGDVCIKAWPRYFKEVTAGRKRFELRLGNRLCAPGATIRLSEFVSRADLEVEGPFGFTGLQARVRVTQSRLWKLAELERFWPYAEIAEKGLCVISLSPA